MLIIDNSSKSISKRFNDVQSKLVLQTADLPLGTLSQMVEAGSIDLQPSFQRRERWNPERQSALIESFLLNVPVPPIYLSEEADGTYSAIDGKQRLKAIAEFMSDRLKLVKLEKFTEIEGIIFSKLPSEIRNPLMLRPFLRVVTLLKQTDKTLKFEVFLRLNRGGETLESQEIRNVAFRGPMNDAVYELSKAPFLRSQMKIKNENSPAFRKMEDAEMVLRYLALIERSDHYSGDLSREMDDFVERYQSAPHNVVIAKKASFEIALLRCEAIWGKNSFKRPEKDGWRDQLLSGMYDAQMLGCMLWTDARFASVKKKPGMLIEETRKLFEDELFDQAVRTGTNTPQRLDYRVKKIKELAPHAEN